MSFCHCKALIAVKYIPLKLCIAHVGYSIFKKTVVLPKPFWRFVRFQCQYLVITGTVLCPRIAFSTNKYKERFVVLQSIGII